MVRDVVSEPVDRVVPDREAILGALDAVADPEIPSVSIVDLGMVDGVRVDEDAIRIELLPTFVGCPALDAIQHAVEDRLAAFDRPVEVEFGFRVPWTSERITPRGRARLRASGFAPPDEATCPFCGSGDVALENLFGPTQCRSVRYCRACRQPFESFKTV